MDEVQRLRSLVAVLPPERERHPHHDPIGLELRDPLQHVAHPLPGADAFDDGHRPGEDARLVAHGEPQYVEWTFGGSAGWVMQTVDPNNTSGVIVLDGRLGKQVRIGFSAGCTVQNVCSCAQDQVGLTVVGYKQ